MNREYNLIVERTINIPYSIDRDDALDLIKEEWNEEIAEQCKNDNKILDKYMIEYAKRVSEGEQDVNLNEAFFVEHDGDWSGLPTWIQLDARDITDSGSYMDGTYDVLWGTDDE